MTFRLSHPSRLAASGGTLPSALNASGIIKCEGTDSGSGLRLRYLTPTSSDIVGFKPSMLPHPQYGSCSLSGWGKMILATCWNEERLWSGLRLECFGSSWPSTSFSATQVAVANAHRERFSFSIFILCSPCSLWPWSMSKFVSDSFRRPTSCRYMSIIYIMKYTYIYIYKLQKVQIIAFGMISWMPLFNPVAYKET